MTDHYCYVAVEGNLDEAVADRLLTEAGLSVERVFGRTGKHPLLAKLTAYNEAARLHPWLVLVDLDASAACAPDALAEWLPHPSQYMCCRVAVREVESWLLADRHGIAALLGVAASRIPAAPDEVGDPKRELVNLARRSRLRRRKAELVPRDGSGASEGPLYTSVMTEFVQGKWNPAGAAAASPSLARCRAALGALRRSLGSEP